MPSEPSALGAGLRWMGSIATTAPMLSAVSTMGWFDRRRAGAWMESWGRLQQAIFGLQVTVDDRNSAYDDPPYLFVHLNQTSLVESFTKTAMVPIPFRLIINFEYGLLPFIGPATIAMGARVIVRQWPTQAKRGIDRAIRDLEDGDSYFISIEGRRSPDGALQPYKKGPAVMAIRAQATVVPFVTFGARERMPYGSWRVRPGSIHGILCEAIPTRGMTYADRDALTAQLRSVAETELRHLASRETRRRGAHPA
ncbi:MAG: lysophospholipid acyltransferase family protein [Deltaproteobacteria bacterium]|jgi:1-acyl-sn-glycerol-3-phosphate acyltransferase